MTDLPNWATQVPADSGVHNAPAPSGQWAGMSQNQLDALRGQLVESIISTVTQALTGLFLPGPLGSAFEQLKDWADNIGEAITESLASLFGRIEDATGVDLSVLLDLLAPLDMSSPGAFFASLMDKILAIPLALGNIVQGVLNGILTIPERLTELVTKLRDFFLGPNSPLSAFNIFGLLQSWNLPFLPVSSLTNTMPNLLVSPGFTTQDSIGEAETANGWEWDDDDGRTDPGCARVDAIGGLQQILQSVPIPVAADQKVNASVYVKWQSLVYTGTDPILLDLVRFDSEGFEVGKTTLESLSSPAASSGGNWLEIDGGEYTIPNDGTTQIVIQFRCRENASAGSIWWDDAELRKTNQTIPQNWILNLVPDLGGIRDWIQDVIDAVISGIRGIPFVGGTLAALILDLTGWREDTDDAASQAADAYIGLGVTQKIIATAAQGQDLPSGVITTPEDEEVQVALQAQTATIISQGAQLEALVSENNGNANSGVRVIDDFEFPAVTDIESTGNWDRFILEGTDPKMATNGHDAYPVNDGTTLNLYSGEGRHTLTDYQKVSVTIAGKLVYPGFGDLRRPHQAVYCRVSDDGTKWVRAYWNNFRQLVVDYRNGGSSGNLYVSGGDTIDPPGPGQNLSIEPGVGVNIRHFRIWRGNTPIATVVDSSEVTYVGADARGHGMGGRIDSSYGPGSFTQYTAIDNAPGETRGIGFRAFRSGTGIGVGTGEFILPSGCIDTVERVGVGMSWDSSTQCLTIDVEGWYLFGLGINTDALKGVGGFGSYMRYGLLYRDDDMGVPAVVSAFGQQAINVNSSDPNTGVGSGANLFGNGIPIMYAKEGSKWYPGLGNSHGTNVLGSAAGASTWFSCALLNRSTV